MVIVIEAKNVSRETLKLMTDKGAVSLPPGETVKNIKLGESDVTRLSPDLKAKIRLVD